MKTTPLEKKFQDAVRNVEQRYAERHMDYLLSALKEAARELQENGMNISLEIRPRDERVKTDTWTMTVSATMIAEKMKLEWSVKGTQWTSELTARIDGDDIAHFQVQSNGDGKWTEPGVINAASFKEAIQNVIINALAERDVAARYDLRGKEFTDLEKPRIKALKTPGME